MSNCVDFGTFQSSISWDRRLWNEFGKFSFLPFFV